MKNLLVINWNGVIPDLNGEFDQIFNMQPDLVLVWNDVIGPCCSLVVRAREHGIPTFVMQHGIYLQEICEYQEHKKEPLADFIFCWNKVGHDFYLKSGFREDQIIDVGCSLMRFKKERCVEEGLVVYAPMHEESSSHLNLMNKINAKEVISILKGSGLKFVVKLLRNENDEIGYDVPVVVTNRQDGDEHLKKTFDLLSKAALVIVDDESTFSTLAASMDIPIIKMSNHYPPHTTACIEVAKRDLIESIKSYLKHPNLKQTEREELSKRHLPDFNLDLMVSSLKNKMKAYAGGDYALQK